MRNIAKQIEKGNDIIERNHYMDMNCYEMKQFIDSFREDEDKHGKYNALFCLVDNAFTMGVSVGYRRGLKDGRKED